MEQISLIEGYVIPEKQKPKGRSKYRKMQDKHGTLKDHSCKDCVHLLRHEYHDRVYFKCRQWILSHSTATDIRLKDIACGLFKESEATK